MGSAMDEEAFIASVSQFLKKENEDRARRFEEQRLHSQNLERQMLEMKEILISMAASHRVEASSSKVPAQNSPSTSVSQAAHQVFDETPKSVNTIEVVQIDESSEYGGEALFEVVNRMERDEDPSQILVRNEPNSAKESSDSTAHHVLDEMPELFADEIDLEIAHQVLDKMPEPKEFHKLGFSDELRTLPTPWVVWLEEEADEKERNLMLSSFTEPQKSGIHLKFNMSGITNDLLLEFGNWMEHIEGNQAKDKENSRRQDLMLQPNPFGSIACLHNFCFDPGGEGIFLGDPREDGLKFPAFGSLHTDGNLGDTNMYAHWVASLTLAAELLVEVLIDSLFEVLIFDPGGHLSIHVAFGFSAVLLMWS